MARLSTIDGGFLLTETHHSPKHVGALMTFQLPKGKGPAWLRGLNMRPINQGLDLRGGVYLLFEVALTKYLPKGWPIFEEGFLWLDNFRWEYF